MSIVHESMGMKVPINFGWCQCGILQCGRPMHWFNQNFGPNHLPGPQCKHATFYSDRAYNPSVTGVGVPTYRKCYPGDRVRILCNCAASNRIWCSGVITSVELFGIVDIHTTRKLTIMLRVIIRIDHRYRLFELPLWEPGITSVNPHLGSSGCYLRPIIRLEADEGLEVMKFYHNA